MSVPDYEFMPRRRPISLKAFSLSRLLAVISLLQLQPTFVLAFVPPKPGSDLEKTFEPVGAYRRRMGITYNYRPKLLNEEMCRYLSEDECRRADESMQEHAKRHQAIQRKLYRQRQRRLADANITTLPGTLGIPSPQDQAEFSELLGAFTKAYGRGPDHFPTREQEMEELQQLLKEFNATKEEHYRRRRRNLQPSIRKDHVYNPSLGTFVVPVLLCRFTDHQDRPLPPKYEYQILWNLRIKKWIQENSYGQYEAFFDVQDWQLTDNTELYYSFGEAGRELGVQKAFFPLMDSMDATLNGDWSLYDVDGDGFIDNLLMIHSGYGAEEAGNDCTNGRQYTERIWSHAFSDSGPEGWVSSNGQYRVRGYMITTGLDLLCDSNPAKMGVMTHEYLHTFFLIDLYDTQFKGKGLGNFDIMAYPYGMSNDGYIPVPLSPWSKEYIEWQTCTPITSSGEYTIPPSTGPDSCYRVTLIATNPELPEYILLENRQQLNFDINFWKPGLVMYHVDDVASDQQWTGYPGIDDVWPASGDHYRVAVIQADRKYDLEKGDNIGDEGDIWQPGMKLTPNTDGQTYPNTDSYQDGYIESTGITIEVLEPDGINVRVKVEFGQRSGNGEQLFATPMREHERERDPELADLADNQFIVPDDPNRTISGKIPQLGWFDAFQKQREEEHEKEATQGSAPDSGQSSGQTLAPSPDEIGARSAGWKGAQGAVLMSSLLAGFLFSLCFW